MNNPGRPLAGATLALALLLALIAGGARAATLVVSNTNDSGSGSLRGAIAAATAGDTITFSVTGTIKLASTLSIGKDLTITGPAADKLFLSGGGKAQVLTLSAGTLAISGLSVTAGADGTGEAGGISNSATLKLSRCAVFGNSSHGLYNAGAATVTNCTFSGNSAGGVDNAANLTLRNCTLSGNTGNGLHNSGRATVANCTVSGNSAGHASGGGLSSTGSAVTTVTNSLIARNHAWQNPDVAGAFSSGGYNLIGEGDGSTGFSNGVNHDQVGTASAPQVPNLGPLQDNGGPTKTMALLSGSPAIDAGDGATAPASDQRGFGRNGASDIGAFEYNGIPPAGALPAFYVKPARVLEGNRGSTVLLFIVRRSFVGSQTESVNYATSDGTAGAGSDYTARTGTLTFTPSDGLTKGAGITVAGDAVTEPDETMDLSLSRPVNATIGTGRATWTIVNDDAVTLVVTNTNDSGVGSLRQAILEAAPSSATVTFAAGLNGTIHLTSGELAITHNLTIRGPGAAVLAVSGNKARRIFEVTAGTVALSGLTLINGYAAHTPGGGIYNTGHLTVTDCTLSSNVSDGNGGGAYNAGTLSLNNCHISGNQATNGSADYNSGYTANSTFCVLTMSGCTLTGNMAHYHGDYETGQGGSICNFGIARLNRCASSGNDSDNGDGTSLSNPGTATLTDCTLADIAPRGIGNGGGRLSLNRCIISGSSFAGILNDGVVTAKHCTFTSNESGFMNDEGTASLSDCVISANTDGVVLWYGGMTLTDCAVSGNSRYGVLNSETLAITQCTFSGNSVGLYNVRADKVGRASVSNSTFSANLGAIGNSSGAHMTVTNCTISGNATSDSYCSGLSTDCTGTVVLTNTLVAGNFAAMGDPDVYGPLTSGGYNLIGQKDGSSGFTNGVNHDQVGTSSAPLDPRLGPLRYNGGPTRTMALLAGSPAINAGNDASAPTTAQRGYSRRGISDIGAFEFNGVAPGAGRIAFSNRSAARLSTGSASAAKGTVTLSFTGPLDPSSAADQSAYTVTVNGLLVAPSGVLYDAATNTVTLHLPQGALRVGDRVAVGVNALVVGR